jgi:hypothetical protein
MPNAKNLPNDYDAFVKFAKISHKKVAISLLNKFSFRYRLAEDFEGIVAPNVGRTLAGYNVITKVFLAYTAYEAAIKAARYLRVSSIQNIELNTCFDSALAIKIRQNEKLKSYLLAYPHEQAVANKIRHFFNGTSSDIVCIAFALRNIFAHGELTASVVGTETIAKRKVFTDLANSLLDYCDETFSLCVKKLF